MELLGLRMAGLSKVSPPLFKVLALLFVTIQLRSPLSALKYAHRAQPAAHLSPMPFQATNHACFYAPSSVCFDLPPNSSKPVLEFTPPTCQLCS